MALWVLYIFIFTTIALVFVFYIFFLKRRRSERNLREKVKAPLRKPMEGITKEKLEQKKKEWIKMVDRIQEKQARIPETERAEKIVDPTGRILFFDRSSGEASIDRLKMMVNSENFENYRKLLTPRLIKAEAKIDQTLMKLGKKEEKEEREPDKKIAPKEDLQKIKVDNVLIIHKATGACLYQQSTGEPLENRLLGGFLTALKDFSHEVSGTKKTNILTIEDQKILLVQGDILIFALNLKEAPSPQFNQIAQSLVRDYEAKYRDLLINFQGDISPFKTSYQFLAEKLQTLAQSQELQPLDKIKRFSQIICPTQMLLKKEYEFFIKMLIHRPTEEEIKMTIERKFKESMEVKPKVEISEFEFRVKEPGKPVEIDLILYAMGFDVDEDTKKMEIPLDRDSIETIFHLTPLREGKRKIQLEICQDTDVIGRVYFNVNVSKDATTEELTETRAVAISSVPQREQRIAARLRIVKSGKDWFQFNLRTFPSPPITPKRPEPIQISEKIFEKVSLLMENAVLSSLDNENAIENLIKLGKIIHKQIPKSIRERIKRLNPKTLVIESGDILIPWEMVHDGERFWSEIYCLGKILVDDEVGNDLYAENIPMMSCIGSGKTIDTALIVANPDRDDLCKLESINEEVEYFNNLEKTGKINLKKLIEPDAKEINVYKLLKEPFNLVHLSSHGLFETDSPENARFVLSDDELTAKEVKERIHLNGWPIIFANACNMGAAIKVSQGASGMARSFLLSGALAYIAPIYVIPDELAAEFAKLFYKEFLKGFSLGDIMTNVRQKIKEKYTGLFWITYTLFGDPTFKLCERIIN
ncbi:MAG: CHAT domain-containing protein [Promethearchaeota archaeon]